MNIILTDKTCQSCGVKLTEYEIQETQRFCIECYKEQIIEQAQ